MLIALEVAGLPVTPGRLEVMMQVMVCVPGASVKVSNTLPVATGVLPSYH